MDQSKFESYLHALPSLCGCEDAIRRGEALVLIYRAELDESAPGFGYRPGEDPYARYGIVKLLLSGGDVDKAAYAYKSIVFAGFMHRAIEHHDDMGAQIIQLATDLKAEDYTDINEALGGHPADILQAAGIWSGGSSAA